MSSSILLPTEVISCDVAVIGGGLAGVCAAIAAARAGSRVALVQNRPVLGGNSSSEVRVWVCGATAHGQQSNARETGIMGELFVENQFRNPQGNPYYWDLVVLEAVRAEPNIELFLNTDIREVDASGPDSDRVIHAVAGEQMGSERRLRFEAVTFVDASGDGLVGFLAGAEYRQGRESFAETQEPWAPEEPDDFTLGSTILFYSHDTGVPEKFVAPSFAMDVQALGLPERRPIRSQAYGCSYWWIEWGGERDVVKDNEHIRDELQSLVYGIWDHIKNSGEYDADTLTLDWIGAVPGKREYRRFVGDHVLTQQNVLAQEEFDDRVAFGGWSIDLHPPGGVYARGQGSKHWYSDGVYHVPLRSLYSKNVRNMWMAGRNISATHVAFGTTRVMATCAVLGEAVGHAAALAVRKHITPRQVATEEFDAVRRAMTRADASVLGVVHDDMADHALSAKVTASSTRTRIGEEKRQTLWKAALNEPLGVVVPVTGELNSLDILVDAEVPSELVVTAYSTSKPQNYMPAEVLGSVRIPIQAGTDQWVSAPLGLVELVESNVFVVVEACSRVSVDISSRCEPGVLGFEYRGEPPEQKVQKHHQWRPWRPIRAAAAPTVRLDASGVYNPDRAVGGYTRPYAGPQMWVSGPLEAEPSPWLNLSWEEPVEVAEVSVVFDDDVAVDLINLHHHAIEGDVMPTLVKDYRIEATTDEGVSRVLVEVTDNRVRHRRHLLDTPVKVSDLRLVMTATNGAPAAHVVSLRAWDAEA